MSIHYLNTKHTVELELSQIIALHSIACEGAICILKDGDSVLDDIAFGFQTSWHLLHKALQEESKGE